MRADFSSRLRIGLTLFLLAGCPGEAPPPDAGIGDRPEILEALVPAPAVEGSLIEVRGLAFDLLGDAPTLEVRADGAIAGNLMSVTHLDDDALLFSIGTSLVTTLGAGSHAVEIAVSGEGASSVAYPMTLEIATSLPVVLSEVPSGEAHRNDVAVLNGAGFIGPSEGELSAHFVGTFMDDAGPSAPVDVTEAVDLLERNQRDRGVVLLTTDLGGLAPGTFEGTVQLTSVLTNGERSSSVAMSTSLHFNRPDLYGLSPIDASVGQILTVRGAGFLGGSERADETTVLRLAGTFTPAGGTAQAFGPVEIVPAWQSGTEVEVLLDPMIVDDRVVSALFGYARGMFAGTATPIVIKGVEELEGEPVPFGFALGAVKQVIYVRFLPGFYDSLELFGLGEVASEVEAAVARRMQAIYLPWNVDFRFEEPTDYSRTAYSVVEIGGPDPNGVGLFGYDNSPGKDVGNLRLFDSIGGTNAETQMDGFPGYGGVFVESILYWSSHPDVPGTRPTSAPDADPLFDMIFDPVRTRPATRAEARGEGDPDRATVVRRAIDALGSIIGETTSHEIGHSLGMAQPYGPPDVYHNDFDGEGCIMDAGGDRPLGERMGLEGFPTTTFCYEHPAYLDEILPR